ncbi:MAG TPA: hypothetical protein PLB49_18200 [Chitinophagaceae bacterium]|jgi:hypothetical protein|nr:hypothetical protein [Chitinophagaceae bacterium]HPH33806.1 hypothetical protein [Chitinophagaceae bacterium]
MKKYYLTGLLFSVLFLSACSKDFLKSYDRRIVGVWKITDINRTGLGGSTSNLPFQNGEFNFQDDGSLVYTNEAGTVYQGTWNIEKQYYNETSYQSLHITVVNFTTQEVKGEYYDDIDFTRTDRFKARINQGLHTYVTRFDR